MSSYLSELNEAQSKAVTHIEGPSLIIAGPGSGKTRVLTFRIAHLIELGVPAWKILALTFTNKAAREMKERIEKVVGDQVRYVWAGTFHSIFARILRMEADKIGYPSTFTIYDTDDTKSLISSIIKEMNLDIKTYNPSVVRARISFAKTKLVTPEMYAQNKKQMERDMIQKRPYIQKIYAQYTARCFKSGAMDFDDLLYKLYQLFLENPDNVVNKYRNQFEYIMVDEFQDTNHLQYQIIRQLINYPGSSHNISVVGDDAQSIYSFRGATIDNILNFEADYPNLITHRLEQNYRSTEHIVEAANSLIGFNKKQIEKKIWTEHKDGDKIKLIKAMADTEEGRRVADLIIEHKNRNHVSNLEIAILYRTNAQSRIFEEYLRRNNIPYRVFGGLSFYQRKEVKDALAYMRLTVNQADEEALKRVINYPKRGIGNTSYAKIIDLANKEGISAWEVITSGRAPSRTQKTLSGFVKMIGQFQERLKTLTAYELALYILQHAGLLGVLKEDDTPEGQSRQENVNALLDGIQEFVDSDEVPVGDEFLEQDKSLSSYLQNIALLTDFDQDPEEQDYVSLMSVHAAKGLEFTSVFVVGMEEKLFPSFMSMDTAEGLDEERRLFYVAITRAKRFLTLSYATTRYRYGKMTYNEPSRFLEEIPEDHLDGVQVLKPVSNWMTQPGHARIQGSFKPVVSHKKYTADVISDADFKPSNTDGLSVGMKVLHKKFGAGEVVKIDGSRDNRVASIDFDRIDNTKRIMLRFAKLQILE